MTGWALAIDFGTSNTVAVLRRPDGRLTEVLFDGTPLLPSAVLAQADGSLLTGRDALHSARLAPERLEPHPKLRVDDGSVLLGIEVPVVRLFAAVLTRVVAEARRVASAGFDTMVLTHPAGWGPRGAGAGGGSSRVGCGVAGSNNRPRRRSPSPPRSRNRRRNSHRSTGVIGEC